MPKLRINRIYADILTRNRESSNQQLAAQLQEASWLIRNVQQRFDTILRVSQAIVDRQRHFFEHGEVAMRPMVLREIADMLDLHESTISRVTTQKYMLTPRGTYELKYFFGSHVATDTGGAASATAIRALIKQLVAAEDAKTPLSDARSRTSSASRASSSRGGPSRSTGRRCRSLPSTCARRRDTRPRAESPATEGECDEPQRHRQPPRHHARAARLRRGEARPHVAPFRPRDRRERRDYGGQAETTRSRSTCMCAARTSTARRSRPTCTRRSTCSSTSSTARW